VSQQHIVQVVNTLFRDHKGSGIKLKDYKGILDLQDCVITTNEENGI